MSKKDEEIKLTLELDRPKTQRGGGKKTTNRVSSGKRRGRKIQQGKRKETKNGPNKYQQQRNRQTGNNKITPVNGVRIGSGAGKNFDKLARQVALSLACPVEQPPIRWASEMDSNSTAVAKPYQPVPMVWPAADAPRAMIPTTDWLACSFRSYARAFVFMDGNPQGNEGQYVGQFTDETYGNLSNFSFDSGSEVAIPVAYMYSANDYSPHGPTLYCGQSASKPDLRFVWVNKGDGITIGGTTPHEVGGTIRLWRWFDGQVLEAYSGVVTGDAFSVKFGRDADTPFDFDAGYYGFTCSVDSSSAEITSLILSIYGPCFCHLPLAGVNDIVGAIQSGRVLASSLKTTPVASVTNLGGQVAMAQARNSTYWTQFINGGIKLVQRMNNSVLLSDYKGSYQFLRPNDPQNFKMKTEIEYDIALGTVTDSKFPLEDSSDFNIVYLVVPLEGQAGNCTQGSIFEYETVNQMLECRPSNLPPEVVMLAVQHLRSTIQFTENPVHWDEIWNSIKDFGSKVLNGIVNYGPKIIEGATMLGGLL